MRRVYYAYALRVGTHPLALSFFLLVASVYGLSRLVHVASIIENLSNVKVGYLGTYILNTFMQAEFFTLVLTGVIFFSLISIRMNLKPLRFHKMQVTH